jgi:hypothetical protein
MHILLEQPLSGELSADKQLIYQAFRQGACLVGNDYYQTSKGFSLSVSNGQQTWLMVNDGLQEALQCKVCTPARARIKLYEMENWPRKQGNGFPCEKFLVECNDRSLFDA